MNTHTYNLAVAAVRSHYERRQAELDAAAAASLVTARDYLRVAATKGVDPESPAYPVCALVAQTIIVGREDGYPNVALPAETRKVAAAAECAGVIQGNRFGGLQFYTDWSGLTCMPDSLQIAINNWRRANEYRQKNKHTLADI